MFFNNTPPAVKNIIVINILVFLAQKMLPNGLGEMLTNYGALYFWENPAYHTYQYITSMFLHDSIAHLFFNMFMLWMFGRILEYEIGSKRFVLYYLISGIGASLFFMCANWIIYNPLVGLIGASGAIYGILMAFAVMHPNERIALMFFPVPVKAKYFVLGMIGLEFLLGVLQTGSPVAHLAHVGGMLFGYALLRYWKFKRKIYY